MSTAAITGTATASIVEGDVVAGGKTLIITLTGDTWIGVPLTEQDSWTGATSADFDFGRYNNTDWVATYFTATNTYTLTALDLMLVKYGSPTGNFQARIYSDSSDLPGTGIGNWSANYDLATIPTSEAWIRLTGLNASIVNGTKYHIVLTGGTMYDPDYVGWSYPSNSITNGLENSTDGTTWGVTYGSRRCFFIAYSGGS